MIKQLLDANIALVRQRVSEADCPATPALSVETLEHMIIDLVGQKGIDVTTDKIEPIRVDWNKFGLAEAYDLVEGVRRDAAQNPESPLDTSLRAALEAIEAADCEWDGITQS